MNPVRILRRISGIAAVQIDADDAALYRSEARDVGLFPADWDGESSLKRCQLCHAYNEAAFDVCRICTEHLPRTTVAPGECSRRTVRSSGH